MKLPAAWPAALRDEGRVTLQVPQVWFPEPPLEDFPDDWFLKVRGFLYISYAGYLANRDEICKAYTQAWKKRKNAPSLEEAYTTFDQYALKEQHENIARNNREIASLEKRLAKLKALRF